MIASFFGVVPPSVRGVYWRHGWQLRRPSSLPTLRTSQLRSLQPSLPHCLRGWQDRLFSRFRSFAGALNRFAYSFPAFTAMDSASPSVRTARQSLAAAGTCACTPHTASTTSRTSSARLRTSRWLRPKATTDHLLPRPGNHSVSARAERRRSRSRTRPAPWRRSGIRPRPLPLYRDPGR